jgi:DNA modification methylase
MSVFTIYSGDANDVIEQFKDGSVDQIFTSPTPPVSDKEVIDLVQFFTKAKRLISDLGGVWINLKNFYGDKMGELPLVEFFKLAMRQEKWCCFADIIWHRFPHDKSKPTGVPHFYGDVEHLLYYTHDMNCYFNDRLGLHNSSIIQCPTEIVRPNEFKSGFPEKVVEICLKVTSTPATIVMDPFCGTGTSLVAALKLGRHAIGIDKGSPEYCKKVEQRLSKFGWKENMADTENYVNSLVINNKKEG